MAKILEEKGLFLVWSEKFFFLTWKLEEKDCALNSTKRSTSFNFEGKEIISYFETHVSGSGILYLRLHNPLQFKDGLFEIFITDVQHAIIFSKARDSNFIDTVETDLLQDFRVRLPTLNLKYPILITCVLESSTAGHSKISKEDIDDYDSLSNFKVLSSDLKKALDKNMHADVALKIGEYTVKVNKMILQARSPVFDKMFCSESLENISNEVVISDIQAETVKRLVDYLYTATVEECDFGDTLELYCAADKYEVLLLRDICGKDLLKHIQVDKACFLFSLAHRHCDDGFKERVVRFISAHFKSVADSDSFAELSRDEMKELTRSVLEFQSIKKVDQK